MRLWTLLFSLLLFFLFLLPTLDTDFGWQLRCGRELIYQGKLCSPDHYSLLLPGYPWAYPIVVFPAVAAVVFDTFSWWGLTFVNSLVVSLTFLLMFKLIRASNWLGMLVIFLAIFLAWDVLKLGFRSQLFSLLFFVITLYLLKSGRFVYLPLLFLLWVNIHGGFVLGLFVVTLWLLIEFRFMSMGPAARFPPKSIHKGTPFWGSPYARHPFVKYYIYVALSFLATLVNPFGWRVYQEDWLHFGGGYNLAHLIAEWVPPVGWVSLSVIFLSGATIIYLWVKRDTGEKWGQRLGWTVMIAVFTILALAARRNLPYAILANIFVASEMGLLSLLSTKIPDRFLAVTAKLALVLTAFFIVFFQFPKSAAINSSWDEYCKGGAMVYPCQALEFLKTQKPGRLFATYEWGGFLIWQAPDFPSLVDGRMPAWITSEGKSPYTIYLETIRTEGKWQKRLKDYQIDYIFIQNGTFLDLKLRPAPERFGWRELYRDQVAVVYKRQ